MIQPLRTILLAIIAAIAFITIDSVLAKTVESETAAEAARLNREGQRLVREGKFDAAIDAFRSAIVNQRDNMQYSLELGRALRAAGHLTEAESTLDDLLKTNAMDGAANLAMARTLVKQGEFEAAAFYYHRAIYGQWKAGDVAASRLKARSELVDMLAQGNQKSDLLAELLPLQTEAPLDAATQEKLANLFLRAGSPARAASIFREQVRIHPDSASLRRSLRLTEQILRLDPMLSELSERERYQRSMHILKLVTDRVEPCRSTPGEPQDLPDRTPEANLRMARQLWNLVRVNCPTTISEADRPLELVLGITTQ